jgi:hypothetical protein
MEWRYHLVKAEALFNECRHAIGLVKVVRYKKKYIFRWLAGCLCFQEFGTELLQGQAAAIKNAFSQKKPAKRLFFQVKRLFVGRKSALKEQKFVTCNPVRENQVPKRFCDL